MRAAQFIATLITVIDPISCMLISFRFSVEDQNSNGMQLFKPRITSVSRHICDFYIADQYFMIIPSDKHRPNLQAEVSATVRS